MTKGCAPAFPLILLLAAAHQQAGYAADPHARALEQQLAAVLRWEILWHGSPKSFRIPPKHLARFALNRTQDFLSYCSQDVRACATYRLDEIMGLQSTADQECCGAQTDQQALMTFVGLDTSRASHPELQSPGDRGEIGGLTGKITPGSGIFWTATIQLDDRNTIISEYKHSRPPALRGLERYLRATTPPHAGYDSITIACFEPTDPLVFFYGVRPKKGPIVFMMFWDKEREEWRDAGLVENPPFERGKIEELRKVIESVACSTVRFK